MDGTTAAAALYWKAMDINDETKQLRYEAARNAFALKMATLHDLSLELSLADDVDELCRRAVILGQRVLGFDRIGIWFVDPDDPDELYGSFGTDEAGRIRDERGARYRLSDEGLPEGANDGKEPVYYLGLGPCFNERHEEVGKAERALALLWDGRKVIGKIWVDNLITKHAIDGGSLELLVRYARIVGSLSSLKRVQAELILLSSTDGLMGVVNRRTILTLLEKQFSLAARKGDDLAVIFCELVGLKAVNDSLGHAASEEYIRIACSVFLGVLRDSDAVGRLGNDEFLVVLPDCNAAGAAIIDARIEAAVAQASSEPRPFAVSLCRGVATCGEFGKANPDLTTKALVNLADKRMRETKSHSKTA
jgi:diguanylate cyclase (GGDEF)-like protein